MKSEHQNPNFATTPIKAPNLSRTHAPPGLSVVQWQRRLRRQFGREQAFGLENLGSEPFFSEFRVSNPVSKSSYRVVIRGLGPGGNFCSCPDYATSELGTCKHLEFAIGQIGKKARCQGRLCARLPARIFRAVFAQRRRAPCAFSRRDGLPRGSAQS